MHRPSTSGGRPAPVFLAHAGMLLALPSLAMGAFSAITAPASGRSSASSTPTVMATPLFSGAALVPHETCTEDDVGVIAQPLPAPLTLPTRLDVVSAPRALPKPEPLSDLWDDVPKRTPEGPRGPSVYQLNLGRAIDILRSDYPKIFVRKPDLSIFTKDVELHDPSGKRVSGIRQYGKVFDLLLFLRKTTMQDATLTYRLVVTDEKIRVRWSAKMWIRDPALGLTTMIGGEPAVVHLDGVSSYELDKIGKIRRHRLENIQLRGQEEAEPVHLAFAWPSVGLATPTAAIPFFRPLQQALPHFDAAAFMPSTTAPRTRSSEPSSRSRSAPVMMSAADGETPMERAARERAEDAEKARRLAELRSPMQSRSERGGLFSAISMPQPCDTSYDCERPEVCCDLLFGSVCCSAGLMIPTTDGGAQGMMQRQAIPIPIDDNRDRGGLPPPGGNPPPRF